MQKPRISALLFCTVSMLAAPSAISEEINPEQIQSHFAHLNDPDFDVRERAEEALEKIGSALVPELEKTLANIAEPETRGRVLKILNVIKPAWVLKQMMAAAENGADFEFDLSTRFRFEPVRTWHFSAKPSKHQFRAVLTESKYVSWPRSLKNDEILVVGDGKAVWLESPESVTKYSYRDYIASEELKSLDLLAVPQVILKMYDVKTFSEETFLGEPVYTLECRAKPRAPAQGMKSMGELDITRVIVLLSRKDFFVRHVELIDEDQKACHTLDVTGLKPATNLSETLFEYHPPAGKQLFDYSVSDQIKE